MSVPLPRAALVPRVGFLAAVPVWAVVVSAAPQALPVPPAPRAQVLFPAVTVLRVNATWAPTHFTVSKPGGQLVGAAVADRFVWLMAWTNGTPLPLCPLYDGYMGSPTNLSFNESLTPGTYTFGEVCGGGGNVTVTRTLEVLYP